jgi:hypothetical protein
LKHDEGKRSPQVDSPMFLLQVINEELMLVWIMVLTKSKVIRTTPTDGALAGSEAVDGR